jgi:ERCC4-related helicase
LAQGRVTSLIRRNQYQFLTERCAREYVEHFKSVRHKHEGWKALEPESTVRQFKTAFEILERLRRQRGVLLADDVGLGKTTVAALCALATARAGKRVRILAPNEPMARRWRQELETQLVGLAGDKRLGITPFLPGGDLDDARRRLGQDVRRLDDGVIAVSTHGKSGQLACDLLIVDEAHRTRSDESRFGRALGKQAKTVRKLLVLTATPFSIDIGDLKRLLHRVGCHADREVDAYSRYLTDLWNGRRTGEAEEESKEMVRLARAAVEAIRGHVIRHGVDDLKASKGVFGTVHPVSPSVDVPGALLEAMLRVDRALDLEHRHEESWKGRRNDPRYHVGVAQLTSDAEHLCRTLTKRASTLDAIVAAKHVEVAQQHLGAIRLHPKVEQTVERVVEILSHHEKVLVFCHHHVVAKEVALAIARVARWKIAVGPARAVWKAAWSRVFEKLERDVAGTRDERLLPPFRDWLCSDGVRAQLLSWIGRKRLGDVDALRRALEKTPPRRSRSAESIAKHAHRLFQKLVDEQSRSTRTVLGKAAASDASIPGSGLHRVIAVCYADDHEGPPSIFVDGQPDTVLAIFNSPFGPDVLVATDRLSEGIDLHTWCRYLIHHELDPSPVRTVQRNGRLRRVNNWAARSGQSLEISYPSLRGTRDERLVEIMKSRLKQFDLVLGGVREEVDPEQNPAQESAAEAILAKASPSLRKLRLSIS